VSGLDPAFHVVTAVGSAAARAIRRHDQNWSGAWERQYLLSTLALALLFTTYERLGPDGRWWFFRLAALAGRQFVGECPAPDEATEISNPFPAAAPPVAPEPDAAPRSSSSGRSGRREIFAGTARAWHLASGGWLAEAGQFLRDARGALDREAPDTAVRYMRGLLDDTIRILGADAELTLEFRYQLGVLTWRAGDAAGARDLFERARVEYKRVFGPDDHRVDACRRARDSTRLRPTAGE
jgi:hypothetical protein